MASRSVTPATTRPALPPTDAEWVLEGAVLRAFLDSIPCPVAYGRVLFRDGQPCDVLSLYTNPAFQVQSDLAPLAGQTLTEVSPGVREASPELLETYGRVALGGAAETVEIRLQTEGARFSVQTFSPQPEHVVAVFAPVTGRKPEAPIDSDEQRLNQSVLGDLTEFVCRFKGDGTILYANEAFGRFFGRSPAELIGTRWQPAVWPEDIPVIEAKLALLSPDQPTVTIENRIVAGGGAIRWGQFVNRAFFDADGELIEMQSVGRDITDRMLAEAEVRHLNTELEALVQERTAQLAASEAQFRSLVEQTEIGIFIQQEGRIVYANPAIGRLHGVPHEALIGRSCGDFIAPEDRKRVLPLAQSMGVADIVFRGIRLGGTRIDLEVHARPFRHAGQPAAIGFIQDVTARRDAERRQQESEQRLRLFIEHAPVAIAMFDTDMRYLEASQRWLAEHQLLGRDVRGLCHYEIYPEVPERWRAVHRRALAGEGQTADDDRFERRDGTVLWIRWEVRPWFLAPDQVGGILIMSEDISARRRLELELARHRSQLEALVAERTKALRASERRFRALFENNRSVMGLIDPESGALIAVNQAAVDFYGYPREVLLSMTTDQFNVLPPGQIALARQRAVESKQNYFRFVHRLADGSLRDVEVYSTPIEVDERQLLFSIVHDINDRVRFEHALRESQATLQRAQAVAHIGSWWIADSTEHFGISAETARLFDLADPHATTFAEWFSRVHPADQAEVESAWRAALRGAPFDINYRIVVRGDLLWIRSLAEIEFDAAGHLVKGVGTVQDITSLKKAEAALRASEETLRLAQSVAKLGSWRAVGTNGDYEVSPEFRRIAGLADDEPISVADWFARVHPEDRPAIEKASQDAMQGSPFDRTYRLVVGDRVKWIRAITQPAVAPSGEVLSAMGSIQDVTEIVEARQELERLNRELECRTRQAEGASLAKGNFLANMSHELRSLMGCILGMTELVLDSDLSPSQSDSLQQIHGSSKALLRLLNDILDYSKIEAGHLTMEQRAFEPARTVRHVADLFAIRIRQKGLQWQARIDPQVPAILIGDDFRLSQVLINLLGNALKFTETGRISLAIDVADATAARSRLRFTLRDTGIGMSPAQAEHLFESFSQGDTSTTRKYGGTGLGLAISKHLIELMGGRIEARTEPGAGSTFVFTAEFGHAAPGAAILEDTVPAAASMDRVRPIQGARVLVVDDQADNLALMKDILERLGIAVIGASSGAAALEQLRHDRFDAVLMDLQMPAMDGLEVTRQIVDRLGDRAPPVLALTAAAMPQHHQASQAAGMVEHLAKPVDRATLVEALLRHILPRTDAEPALRPLTDPEREGLGDLLSTLERHLASGNFNATRVAAEIQSLLAGTVLAGSFAPIAAAAGAISFKSALRALAEFREQVSASGQEPA